MVRSQSSVKLLGEIHTPIWSGDRLSRRYDCFRGKGIIGEAWMTSPNADAVINGETVPFGEFLNDLGLPLPPLVKLIDAASPLSVQVHPDDASATKFGGTSKNEIWYVLDADDYSEILYGTKPDITLDEIRNTILCGDVEPLLNRIHVKKADVYMIPCGMIHSLGGGITVLEIQNRNGTTYRVKDIAGNRETHPAQSADCVRIISPAKAEEELNNSHSTLPGKVIVSSSEYSVSVLTSLENDMTFTLDDAGIYMFCEKGSGVVSGESFTRGDSLYIPSENSSVTLHPDSSVILVK